MWNCFSWNADSEKLWTFVSDIQEWLEKVVHRHKTDVLLTRILLAAPIHSYFYFLLCYLSINIWIQLTFFNLLTIPPVFSSILCASFEFTSVKIDILNYIWFIRERYVLFSDFFKIKSFCQFFSLFVNCFLFWIFSLQSARPQSDHDINASTFCFEWNCEQNRLWSGICFSVSKNGKLFQFSGSEPKLAGSLRGSVIIWKVLIT